MFEHKTVMITGAASGFGKRLAERLSEQGANLVLSDYNFEALEATATGLPSERTRIIACNVMKEDQVKAQVALGVEAFGSIDMGVNNAGTGSPMKSLIDVSEDEMDFNFAVNAKGVFFGMKHQIPVMLENGGGQILNVASLAGLNAAPKLTPYCAAKHAVIGLTKTAAFEYARKNIRVNAICPSYVKTPLVTDNFDDELQAMLTKAVPMGRLGETDEVIEVMLGVLNPANTYMTGQSITVDGGVSAV
ncbi:MAG: SDR family oxidoreductase [Mangrovicoccus sp.]|nr:SDR family oxidoreductase [Mangrovicoccus sp.]